MEQTVLTPWQKTVIAAIAAESRLADFYLSGGTALAGYHLFHRYSDDLDFFIFGEEDRLFLHEFTPRLQGILGAEKTRFERLYDRNQFFFRIGSEEMKVEFTRYPFRQIEMPAVRDGICVDGLRDIAANKLMALLDRFDPKDFVDMYFLLQNRTLAEIRRDTETKFSITISDMFLGGELAKVQRIAALPRMIKPLIPEELKVFFTDQARSLASGILR